MLSLLKRKSDAGAAPVTPAWHPNFRNYEKLPDIKVVRTAFFVNGLAVLAACSAATYFGFQEWKLRVVNSQIAQVQAQIDRDKKTSDQAVALFRKFQAEEARINEVDAFLQSKPRVSALLMRLGQTLPPTVALDSIDLREAGLLMRISVKGAADVAPGYATAYLEQLRADPELAQLFEDFAFTSTPMLNPVTNRLTVEFMLRLKSSGKKA